MGSMTYGEWIAQKNEGRLWPIYEADKHDLAFEYSLAREMDDAIKDYMRDANRMLFGQDPVINFDASFGGEIRIPIKKVTRDAPYYGPHYSILDQLTLFELPWWATGAPLPKEDDWYDDYDD